MMRPRSALLVVLAAPLVLAADQAATFTARVVGITDGDTLTVVRDRTQVKIRLHGIARPALIPHRVSAGRFRALADVLPPRVSAGWRSGTGRTS